MIRLFIISLLLIMASCGTERYFGEHSTRQHFQSDSIIFIEKEIITVDTILIPAETLKVNVPIEVFKHDTTVIYRQGRASTKIIYKNGLIQLDTRCDSLQQLVLNKEKLLIKERQKNAHFESSNIQIKEVKKRKPDYIRMLVLITPVILMILISLYIIKNKIKRL